MEEDDKMKLEEAGVLADKVIHCIEDLCERIQVVGSIRRKRPEVHDVDIVLIPKPQPPFFAFTWDAVATKLQKQLNMKLIRKGRELMSLGFQDVDLPVDIYKARPETWGTLLLIRTGSVDHNVMMCSRAQKMGMMLSASDGVIKDGKVIASRTEEEIFKALEMDFVPPEKRETP